MGIGRPVTKTTLSRANENRDWRMYADFALLLIDEARPLYGSQPTGNRVEKQRIRHRLDGHRLVFECLQLGEIPQVQSGSQAAP